MECADHDIRESQDAVDGDDRSRGPRSAGGESFDLAALCLSPLMSPAMTTAVSGSEGFSVLSDGLSLATDDKEEEDRGAESSGDDDDDEGKGQYEHNREQGEVKDQEGEDKHRDGSEEKGDEGIELRDNSGSEDETEVEPGEALLHGRPEDPTMADEVPSVPKLPLSQDNEAYTVAHRATYRYENDSDDDMTVECASPRDPRELEDTELLTVNERERHDSRRSLSSPATALNAVSSPNAMVTAAPPAPLQAQYSLKTIFPVVYEQPLASTRRVEPRRKQKPTPELENMTCDGSQPAPKVSPSDQKPKARVGPRAIGGEDKAKVKPHHAKEAAQQNQLQSATKSLALQLQVAETDRKQLAQRHARLKSQLELLTADLVRTKADAAKWKTENELYAAKMPKLQAELSEETTQVDEKHALTIQSQLEISQLRAKVQVLQTRAGNLDAQVEKLQNELRAAKKEGRRRAISQQQTDEKVKRLETELHEAKASHVHELHRSKHKLTATVQRMDHDRVQALAELKKTHHQQLEEARAALAKATKKWKELEHTRGAREQELLVLKKCVEDVDEHARTGDRQAKTAESLLARAERTEVSLRSQIATLKAQVQVAEREKRKASRAASTAMTPVAARSVRANRSAITSASARSPRILLISESTTSDNGLLCSCCRMVLDSVTKADRMGEPDEDPVGEDPPPSADCARCRALETEVTTAHDKLMQVCTLHASELKVQATAYERMLVAFRGGATDGVACAEN